MKKYKYIILCSLLFLTAGCIHTSTDTSFNNSRDELISDINTYFKLPLVDKKEFCKKLIKEGRNVLTVRASLPPCSSWSHVWLRMVHVGLGATKLGGGTFTYDPLVKGE